MYMRLNFVTKFWIRTEAFLKVVNFVDISEKESMAYQAIYSCESDSDDWSLQRLVRCEGCNIKDNTRSAKK